MKPPQSRREFLAEVGRGMIIATVGSSLASDLGLATGLAQESAEALTFGELEPLVCLMQESAPDQLLEKLVARIHGGSSLRQLVAAGALANARTFGGEDYVGFHTMMALAPALAMAQELPADRQPLPVFKVLYRNTNRIQEKGGRQAEILRPVPPGPVVEGAPGLGTLGEAIHRREVDAAERALAVLAEGSPEEAFNVLLHTVQEQTEVHRVVLPYRAWDLLDVTGPEHAHTMLRQSVRYCIRAEPNRPRAASEPTTILAKLLDEHRLLDRQPGTRAADDKWIDDFSQALFAATPSQAADAAASALAEGFVPDAIGEAISLAANQLVLRDHGRRPSEEAVGKPVGSVHGDSIGVHACDSANAWRNMARVSNTRNTFACLILGAYQVALDRVNRGGDFLTWQPVPMKWHLDQVKSTAPAELLRELDEAIRNNLQARAAALVSCSGALGHPARPIFDLMLGYAVSEDGALHAEKYYRTVVEEFERTRETFRWRQLLALARVTASEFGRPAPGVAQARELLKA